MNSPALILGSLLLLASAASADVLVVASGGGGAFIAIQPAIDAAQGGDVVLVEPGTYAGFGIDDEHVAVVADTGGTVLVQGGVLVANLGATRDVLLHGLTIDASVAGVDADGLRLIGNAGSIRLQQCSIRASRARIGLVVEGSPDVAATSCTIDGGDGIPNAPTVSNRNGNHAAAVRGSRVAFYGCALHGGSGWQAQCGGYNGGSGLAQRLATVFAAGSSIVGRPGTSGGSGFDTSLSAPWPDGGNGGHAVTFLWPTFSPPVPSTFTSFANLLQPGAAGQGTFAICGGCGLTVACQGAPGIPGQAIAIGSSGGGAEGYVGSLPLLTASVDPVRELASTQLAFLGAPGDEVMLFFAPETGYVPSQFRGIQLVGADAPLGARVVGTIGASGTLVFTLRVPELGPGVESLVVHVQSMHKNAGGHFVLGNAVHLVLLDQAF